MLKRVLMNSVRGRYNASDLTMVIGATDLKGQALPQTPISIFSSLAILTTVGSSGGLSDHLLG